MPTGRRWARMTERPSETDLRFMAAAIRYAERHSGRTGTNPSVGTVIVRDDGEEPRIVGRGVTALGGRPHAEPVALAEAGELARGATAYVTLEPCAHHGRTPPCAEALIRAGVARVVVAAGDPDSRVDGKGAAMLRASGIEVTSGVMAQEARRSLAGYLSRVTKKRPEVTMKIAVSADGMIGRIGGGQVAITGPAANAQTHLLRARTDAIMIGAATLIEDDPILTCRLAGLEKRSPLRIVLDGALLSPLNSRIVRSAREVPAAFATLEVDDVEADAFRLAGCEIIACEAEPGTTRIALPELLEDLAARGISMLLVEAGAKLGRAFLEQDLVDRLILIEGQGVIGADGVAAPVSSDHLPESFAPTREYLLGADRWREWERREPDVSTDEG
ncbi:bifunctional diaminohydroxyphosphoribosylaminopyrimidine deaminase/5-amino-6-(5-phosphoribosylamino)uracil reductase RibD [Aureimonas psammosilenae]|uniref:bifunctional diaminohydroxyphosphoribosylaminopyrimidine deaminase/5-amino-6-(5-phosphoribosylamino)uracil reductase RibD n=1 Tax=Aureimonas psammosilenae TaxID=2495496 RepID=UPI001EEF6ADD|nr:bifunctional diaminohydroxyphosphoribosylaminopyrimidine deaminase/5-amino-6-(5-phosphoribosylamino)uracil reductase RibD [Aureimonas psammosilenae]